MNTENNLFPIFLKIRQIKTLIVGGGNVALEKLNALLKNDPGANIVLIGREISGEIRARVNGIDTISLHQRAFLPSDLHSGIQMLILATNNRDLNAVIYGMARAKGILTNVADTPDLCDFYLGSTVTKGNLKIGISTNGQSPTFAKRFREVLEDILPDETNELVNNLNKIRNSLKVSFSEKVRILNDKTKELVSK
ncbi:bifunctional precorrin-2 dehydrogenase/sirohydrochlorin ferrochelatase [Fulvivirga ulvae]|uniref:precorrin-2 dehydrogenase/sirohydrochlorin ferrochelatase family protein n=1 Tax=Fulvivirga ulvae TaxID=2904245 RepID=UPI001F24280A|nr:bifunctional precorrin-2 dehydrogenase/sirohydrochlorin ferrochelatase [Fulvivirga ulvae]UII32910.1 bifunctional precorrin-2 dehydrogenase/sirohydrochlorin ferrochelatase [Fulvivirga ulvae]